MRRVIVLAALAALCVVPGASAAPYRHTVDLAQGTLDGHRVFGLSVAQVSAALGWPSFHVGGRDLQRIGWGRRGAFTREVLFRRDGGRLRAVTLVLESGSAVDPKVGDLVAQAPARLVAKIRARYAGQFTVARPFACTQALCSAELVGKESSLHVTVGRTKARGTFVTIWDPLA